MNPIIKKLVRQAQKDQARLDFALGKAPRKTSKTYSEAYAREYELEQRNKHEYIVIF